ncbi:MAG TPA: hypothetical protein VGF65_02550, partial [Mycobacterium sp.]
SCLWARLVSVTVVVVVLVRLGRLVDNSGLGGAGLQPRVNAPSQHRLRGVGSHAAGSFSGDSHSF